MSIRLFIGTSANGEDADAEMVYEHSLRQNVNVPLEITWMRLNPLDTDLPLADQTPWGGWDTRMWPTPFSGLRWAIPEACKFNGRAIYTDVDMINFRNIQELWTLDMGGKAIMSRRGPRFGGHEFCVMLIDCAKLGTLLPPIARMKTIPEMHFRMIRQFSGSEIVGDLDPRWNVLDGENYKIEEMYQVHFTNMGSQPWKPVWYRGNEVVHPRPDICDYWFQYRNRLDLDYTHKNQANIDYPAFGQYTIIGQ